jgi:hypothetical protein
VGATSRQLWATGAYGNPTTSRAAEPADWWHPIHDTRQSGVPQPGHPPWVRAVAQPPVALQSQRTGETMKQASPAAQELCHPVKLIGANCLLFQFPIVIMANDYVAVHDHGFDLSAHFVPGGSGEHVCHVKKNYNSGETQQDVFK